jgi:stage V sporulation protein G
MAPTDQIGPASELVTFIVGSARSIDSKQLFALVDVEMRIADVSFWIRGVRARRLPEGGTSMHLPTYKETDGTWRAAMQLPEELCELLADAVLNFLVEEGLARPNTPRRE